MSDYNQWSSVNKAVFFAVFLDVSRSLHSDPLWVRTGSCQNHVVASAYEGKPDKHMGYSILVGLGGDPGNKEFHLGPNARVL